MSYDDELLQVKSSIDSFSQGIKSRFTQIEQEAATKASEQTTHSSDTNNPHGVTKTQVGLSNVQNYAIATQLEAEEGLSNLTYMTPQRVAQAITALAGTNADAHIARTDNPHGVTKTQVGLGNIPNAVTNVRNMASDLYLLTALGMYNHTQSSDHDVRYYTKSQMDTTISNHTTRIDNPHSVTKAQVGLGDVQNLGLASQAEAETGTANNRYMTPLRVREAIAATVSSHVGRTDNPHAVTKDQVGLGSVYNYPLASQAEAEAGTLHTRYMTPLRTDEAITAKIASKLDATATAADSAKLESLTLAEVVELISASTGTYIQEVRSVIDNHKLDTLNPHNVTKAQVGLGNVLNYGIASQAEAEAGTLDDKYMTPLRVKEAISALASAGDPNAVTSTDFSTIVAITSVAYDALSPPDSNTLYIITEA